MVFRFKQVAGIVLNTAIFAVLLFLPAGTVYWPRAWVLLGVVFMATALSIFSIPEDLLNERYKPPLQAGQPLADKIVVVAFVIAFMGTIVLIPLDVFRFHLMDRPGTIVSGIGLLLFAAGWWLVAAALSENAFAVLVVRLQKERRQQVVDSGPYRFVRHPMYSSVIPMLLGIALWLGSYAAVIVAIIPMTLIAIRVLFEEKFLRRELSGYVQYSNRTRFRLVPFVW